MHSIEGISTALISAKRAIIYRFTVAQMVKSLPAMQETQVQSLGQEDPWRRKWQATPVLLPGEFYG